MVGTYTVGQLKVIYKQSKYFRNKKINKSTKVKFLSEFCICEDMANFIISEMEVYLYG